MYVYTAQFLALYYIFVFTQAIKRTNQEDSDLCYTSLLEHWLTQTKPLPKVTNLTEALRSPSIERGDLANMVEAMFVKD